MKSLFGLFKQEEDTYKEEYHVKVFDKENDEELTGKTFKTRREAREYKAFRKETVPGVVCHIIRRIWVDGYIHSEWEVW